MCRCGPSFKPLHLRPDLTLGKSSMFSTELNSSGLQGQPFGVFMGHFSSELSSYKSISE